MGPRQLRIYVDADILIAGAAGSPYGASHVLLVAANVTPLTLISAETAVLESRKNVEEKLPEARFALDDVIKHSIRRVDDPAPRVEDRFRGLADEKDAIHLATAVVHDCKYLVTYNVDDYQPGHEEVEVVRPGVLVQQLREVITPAVFSGEVW